MAQRITITNNRGSFSDEVVCFGGLHIWDNVPIKNLYYNIRTEGKDKRREATLLRNKLVPALGLDIRRVTIHKTQPNLLDVTVRSKKNDSMWDVFILTSLFRNFSDNATMAHSLSRLIMEGMDPVVAMSVSSRIGYHPRLKRYYSMMAGEHALINRNPVTNYHVINQWMKGKSESNTLQTTGRGNAFPRPTPRIDSVTEEFECFYRSSLLNVGSIIENLNEGEPKEVEKWIKEAAQ